jgi:phosphonate degradation associated HDIG domain protein
MTPDQMLTLLFDLLERRGAETYLGEAVTMQAHMLQSARLAEAEGASDALVAAALLHDIGHIAGGAGPDDAARGIDRAHEAEGARLLAPHFPPVVVACVRLHVAAKRYLCATDAAYEAALSPASAASLRLQGGRMRATEAAAFRRQPFWAEALRVRRWDDAAKVPGAPTPPFAHYLPLLRRVLADGPGATAG